MMENQLSGLFADQQAVRGHFIDEIWKDNPKIGNYLKRIFIVSADSNRENRICVYDKILNELPFGSIEREKLLEYYAKIMDLERRVRKFDNAKMYNERLDNPASTATADHFSYVFTRMEQEGVECEKVKEFFIQNAYALFSLTMHPTNPTSIDYTIKGGIEFDKCLENKIDYKDQLAIIKDLSLAGRKKTVSEEIDETIAILDMIYDTTPKVRQKLIQTLENFPLYRNVIDVDLPLIQAAIWAAGDGDGNENANIEALEQAIKKLKHHIKCLYLMDVEKLLLSNENKFIEEKLLNDKYQTVNELINDLKSLSNSNDLIYKIKTFGFYYAQIDIRHNAVDIMETITHLTQINGLIENFSSLSIAEQKKNIINWFTNDKIINKLSLTDHDQLNTVSKTAARIFGRLKLIKNNQDMFNKLIIAETNSVVNVLACLLLLKAAGSCVAEEHTIIDIVTLSESVKDLEELPNLIRELIDDKIYRKHLFYRQKLIPMIAKSDTVRRNGRGAEASQEKALGTLYAMLDEIKIKYPELKNLTINGFSGGGAALQRGGGRVTEVAHNNGRSARFFGAKTIGPSLLTIQGHQMQILFSPSSIALQTLESLVAQNIHARAQTELKINGEHYVPPRKAPEGYNEREYIQKFHDICGVMRKTYFEYMGDLDDESKNTSGNYNFNQLFANGPWISVLLGNLSSRPSKRGGNTKTEDITVKELKGENPKLLNNRAITVERLTAHSGTHFLNYFGVREGLKSLKQNELHSMYICSKSCRDFMRNTALSLHMTDFDLAWHMMIGDPRPNQNELILLANKFDPHTTDKNLNRETLAWLELYALDVAKLVYICLLDKQPPEDFNLRTPLKHGFTNLAQQLTVREEGDEFGRYAESSMTNLINNNLNLILGEHERLTLQACYAAADVVNAPEGGLNIELTRKKPGVI
ncbi:unnamed protein product [Didymodactylos carnosus]|uniref:Phosphoenolpyruvate carboxylase n=1 Tax=Didymodactylos carnosus TaxID=1234261 RepID=A0A814U927_9BILA|nr:unnamed protein product [Didymodactylos carnosus]CAF1168908.1 unnamed protein product [Didymodactylos carnosus]CAF3904912.1 unnamed protein product [Didymodactylos carnosus]CAF3932622.1 unnamed protein product [Didymodactylos carnosus]